MAPFTYYEIPLRKLWEESNLNGRCPIGTHCAERYAAQLSAVPCCTVDQGSRVAAPLFLHYFKQHMGRAPSKTGGADVKVTS